MSNPHLRTSADIDLSRRSFLKLGIAGTVALSSTSLIASMAGCGKREEAVAQGFRFLRDADVLLFRALAPVVLDGLLPEAGADRESRLVETLHRIDAACVPLTPSPQAELRKLFDLLNLRVTRYLSTGIGSAWPAAQAADIDAFLERWKGSSLGMFNAGYRALIKLVSTSYFGIPATWPQAGYPGPLDWVYKAVNS